jgi:hypothetical protein
MLFMVLQLLVASLAGLLVLDHRLRDRERAVRGDFTRSISVTPGPTVHWLVETDVHQTSACTRRSIAHRPSARHVPSTHHPRPYEH